MNKKLYRDEYHKVLGGVCSGLAEYFEMDVTIVRLLFAFTFFVMGVGLGTYIILWIVLPKKGYPYNPYNSTTVDYTVPPQQPGDQQFTAGGSPFGGNTWAGNPFVTPPVNTPMPPKQRSNTGLIIGVVLIIVGAAVLIDNFDLIPDFDFDKLWPAILVIVGGALIVSGQTKNNWHHQDWKDADKKEEPITGNTADDASAL